MMVARRFFPATQSPPLLRQWPVVSIKGLIKHWHQMSQYLHPGLRPVVNSVQRDPTTTIHCLCAFQIFTHISKATLRYSAGKMSLHINLTTQLEIS